MGAYYGSIISKTLLVFYSAKFIVFFTKTLTPLRTV